MAATTRLLTGERRKNDAMPSIVLIDPNNTEPGTRAITAPLAKLAASIEPG